ncbi:MAG: hypothetical protein DRR03_03065 [Gammaproteobacteria bacterium]|nr:MAG: hypothetical protein DRR03_03065 [Gammaproteobacteria bacterium]
MTSTRPAAPRLLLYASLLLLPFQSQAFDITYEGDFILSGPEPAPITHNAIPVTRYVSVVTTISPVTDAHDRDGSKHCWYMIDRERGFKAMIAERPIDEVGPDPFGANGTQPSAKELSSIAEFVHSVYREAEDSGGIKKLSERCSEATS